ncbi:hypothetical protein [Rhodoferax antarcticus]|nr:hypothetical protein [Rhodoferax antarcticus]MCW2311475.1 hypothetical protein [Rhodoferax antarcticus]
MAIIGAILAQGAIRLLDSQKGENQLAKLTEERVHGDHLPPQGDTP